eukprot:12172-Amorphochlora_amoeboformis.AAC.1
MINAYVARVNRNNARSTLKPNSNLNRIPNCLSILCREIYGGRYAEREAERQRERERERGGRDSRHRKIDIRETEYVGKLESSFISWQHNANPKVARYIDVVPTNAILDVPCSVQSCVRGFRMANVTFIRSTTTIRRCW